MIKTITTLLIGLTAAAGCATTNRTYYQTMYRDGQTFQGVRTEAEKERFRYGVGIEVMDVDKENLEQENESVPIIGEVSYDGKVKHHQVNIVPSLDYSVYDLRGRLLGQEGGIEARVGGGTELQVKVDIYKYDFRTFNEEYNFDGPFSSIDPDANFFLATGLNFDYWHLSGFLQAKLDMNKNFAFAGGAGVRW